MNCRLHQTIVTLTLVAMFCSLLNTAEAGLGGKCDQILLGKPNVIWFQNTTWQPVKVTYLTIGHEHVTVTIEKRTTKKLKLYQNQELLQVLADGELLQLRESRDGTKYRLTRGLFSRDFSLEYTVPGINSLDD
jgi:hypothetical protein